LSIVKESPTILFEDNDVCNIQFRKGYIKGDKTKHISPKFFYTHELQQKGKIDIKQITSGDNLTDLFSKSLSHVGDVAAIVHPRMCDGIYISGK
jgi:hypothetical protein